MRPCPSWEEMEQIALRIKLTKMLVKIKIKKSHFFLELKKHRIMGKALEITGHGNESGHFYTKSFLWKALKDTYGSY